MTGLVIIYTYVDWANLPCPSGTGQFKNTKFTTPLIKIWLSNTYSLCVEIPTIFVMNRVAIQ